MRLRSQLRTAAAASSESSSSSASASSSAAASASSSVAAASSGRCQWLFHSRHGGCWRERSRHHGLTHHHVTQSNSTVNSEEDRLAFYAVGASDNLEDGDSLVGTIDCKEVRQRPRVTIRPALRSDHN